MKVTNLMQFDYKMKNNDFKFLKYSQLQKLAKEHRIKANVSKAEIIKALSDYFGRNK